MTWAVIQCESQRELAVCLLLGRMTLPTYFPRIRLRKRIVGLFPGYVFCRLGPQFYPVLWTPHVIRLLMAGDRPAKLSDEIVENIRKLEHRGLIKLPQPPRLRLGQQVKVIRGSFQGLLGLYDGQSGKDRERVLLELLGRKVRIELSAANVVPIQELVQ